MRADHQQIQTTDLFVHIVCDLRSEKRRDDEPSPESQIDEPTDTRSKAIRFLKKAYGKTLQHRIAIT